MIYAIGLGSNLNSRYGNQYQTLKKAISCIRKKKYPSLKNFKNIYNSTCRHER